MELKLIFDCFDAIDGENLKNSECISNIAKIINTKLGIITENGMVSLDKSESFKEFATKFDCFMKDERLQCAVSVLYLLHCTSHSYLRKEGENKQLPELSLHDPTAIHNKRRNVPEAPPELISLKHLKDIELCIECILYTVYFAALDEEAALYLKLKIIRDKLLLGNNVFEISPELRHESLKLILNCLLPLMKHESIGSQLLTKFLPEIFCGLLQLSFCPKEITTFPEDVAHFRGELETVFEVLSSFPILKSILLLKGAAAQRKGKSWLRSVCQSLYLRRFLLKEGGVQLTLKAALSLGDFGDWRKKETIGALVSAAKAPNEIEFFSNVCGQMLILLKEEKNGDMFQVLSFMVLQLSKRSAKLTQTQFFEPFLAPLFNLTSKGSLSCPSGEGLIQVISTLYKLFVEVLPPSGELAAFLSPVICPLTAVSALPPTCHVKTEAQLILVRYLTQLENENIISTILVMAALETSETTPPLNPEIKLVSRLNEIEVEIESFENNWVEMDEQNIKCLIEIIKKLKLPSVVLDLVRKLTVYFNFTVLNDFEVNSTHLLTESDINSLKFEKIRKLTIAVTLLNSICEDESLTADLFSDLSSALPIIDTLLQTHSQEPTNLELAQTKDSFLMNCVMLLYFFVNEKSMTGKMTSSDWKELQILTPSLREMEKNSSVPSLTGLVEQLIQIILTHGVIGTRKEEDIPVPRASNASTPSAYSTCAPKTSGQATSTKSLPSKRSSSPPTSDHNSETKESLKPLSSYQEALVEVCSPYLPVRGHAILSLTKLVQTQDDEALRNSDKILSLFEHHLRDEDSYIYLAAIEGIVVLSTHFPQKVVTILTEEFARANQTIETRLKLIEILTKTSRLLGPVLPKYKNLFLNCLLNGVKDDCPLVRASCLSNLGEVCKALRFSVESVIHEIFSVVENVVKNDKSPEVKRAGVLFVTLLLQGLGKDMIKVLQAVILDLYRSLKKLIMIENDVILVTQAELAIQEINTITREFLVPKISLTKKIFITEIPSNPL